ncbi:RNA-binding protein [bacterium]|nr:RNA-binding protein [bacterium]
MDIYVGNLSYDATDDDLQGLFQQYGTVASARVIMDKMSGRSRGFGFIEMPDKSEGDKAVETANGLEFQGRTLRVNESQPRQNSRDSRGGGDRR